MGTSLPGSRVIEVTRLQWPNGWCLHVLYITKLESYSQKCCEDTIMFFTVVTSWKESHTSMMAVTIGPDKDRLLTHCTPSLCNTRIPPRVDVLKKWRPLWGTLVSGRFQCFYLELLKFFNRWWKKFPERKPHPHNGRHNRSRQGQVVKDSS